MIRVFWGSEVLSHIFYIFTQIQYLISGVTIVTRGPLNKIWSRAHLLSFPSPSFTPIVSLLSFPSLSFPSPPLPYLPLPIFSLHFPFSSPCSALHFPPSLRSRTAVIQLVWGALWAPPAEAGAEPEPKSNLMHFSFKIWHLLTTILIIFLGINLRKIVYGTGPRGPLHSGAL